MLPLPCPHVKQNAGLRNAAFYTILQTHGDIMGNGLIPAVVVPSNYTKPTRLVAACRSHWLRPVPLWSVLHFDRTWPRQIAFSAVPFFSFSRILLLRCGSRFFASPRHSSVTQRAISKHEKLQARIHPPPCRIFYCSTAGTRSSSPRHHSLGSWRLRVGAHFSKLCYSCLWLSRLVRRPSDMLSAVAGRL